MQNRLCTAVLMGGMGGERAISLKSGKAVCEGLLQAGHKVIPYEVNDPALPGLKDLRPDVAFIALHGTFGEDGTVQRLLEEMEIPYTGSGPEASRIGMDKLATKRLFIRHGIPTPDYFVVGSSQSVQEAAWQAAQFGYPVVCKPARSGSSLGISIVKEAGELAPALEAARQHCETVIVERYVRGREFTVGILEGEALPMIELVVGREFFDYEAKYCDQRTQYITPVHLLPTLYRKATIAAVRAYMAIGCRHMARVDLIYGHDGSLNVLEVNTIPGFTPRSLLPMAAAQAGIPFPELCDRIVRAALRDAAQKVHIKRLTA